MDRKVVRFFFLPRSSAADYMPATRISYYIYANANMTFVKYVVFVHWLTTLASTYTCVACMCMWVGRCTSYKGHKYSQIQHERNKRISSFYKSILLSIDWPFQCVRCVSVCVSVFKIWRMIVQNVWRNMARVCTQLYMLGKGRKKNSSKNSVSQDSRDVSMCAVHGNMSSHFIVFIMFHESKGKALQMVVHCLKCDNVVATGRWFGDNDGTFPLSHHFHYARHA